MATSALANIVVLRSIVRDPSLLEEEEVMVWSLRSCSSLILWTERVLVAEMYWVQSWRVSSGLAAPRTLLRCEPEHKEQDRRVSCFQNAS